jgi:hypothetical protein
MVLSCLVVIAWSVVTSATQTLNRSVTTGGELGRMWKEKYRGLFKDSIPSAMRRSWEIPKRTSVQRVSGTSQTQREIAKYPTANFYTQVVFFCGCIKEMEWENRNIHNILVWLHDRPGCEGILLKCIFKVYIVKLRSELKLCMSQCTGRLFWWHNDLSSFIPTEYSLSVSLFKLYYTFLLFNISVPWVKNAETANGHSSILWVIICSCLNVWFLLLSMVFLFWKLFASQIPEIIAPPCTLTVLETLTCVFILMHFISHTSCLEQKSRKTLAWKPAVSCSVIVLNSITFSRLIQMSVNFACG